jgi:hypothetical protein
MLGDITPLGDSGHFVPSAVTQAKTVIAAFSAIQINGTIGLTHTSVRNSTVGVSRE